MPAVNSLPMIGMSCTSYTGEHLSNNQGLKPPAITLDATGISTAYYRIGDDFDNTNRYFSILEAVVTRAIERSQLSKAEIASLGLFIGSSSYDLHNNELLYWNQIKTDEQEPIPLPHPGCNLLGNWICERFNITTEPYNINTACTSSANALLTAQCMINKGVFKQALIIGIELFNETTVSGFAGLQLLSASQLSPLDKNRDGLLLGEGCAAVVLGRKDQQSSLWLAGGGVSIDPHSITAGHTDGSSIADAVASALDNTGIMRSRIQAIKLHGTGSYLNDLSECNGLKLTFKNYLPLVTAIKPYIGHTLGACGVIELVLFGNALKRGYIPHTPNYVTPDPEIALTPITFDKPSNEGFYLLNYFGFGGSNTIIVLEKRHCN